MEGLLVDGIDRHLGRAEQARIIKRADLQDYKRKVWWSRCQMGPAFATKLTRHRIFEIGAREFARLAARVTKALRRHEHEHVRPATCDVLAFAAMTLCLEPRLAFSHVENFAGIAPRSEARRGVNVWMSGIASDLAWTSR